MDAADESSRRTANFILSLYEMLICLEKLRINLFNWVLNSKYGNRCYDNNYNWNNTCLAMDFQDCRIVGKGEEMVQLSSCRIDVWLGSSDLEPIFKYLLLPHFQRFSNILDGRLFDAIDSSSSVDSRCFGNQ